MTQPHDRTTASPAPTPKELREQVEHSRQELGHSIEAAAGKTDVKAAEAREQAGVKAGELRARAAEAASRVQDKLPDPVKDKAVQAAGQVRAKAARAGRLIQDRAPEPVRAQAAQGAQLARDNRTLLLAAAGAGVGLWLLRRTKG
ncbi:hypothetical protein ACFC5X_33435 [Streptomyces sp. NPDC055952]|uniref:hypothetical protein n=1 Tax=Streptomyces sp. NPDC055952 TaxID=3345663 RepID=UPI0035DB8DBF